MLEYMEMDDVLDTESIIISNQKNSQKTTKKKQKKTNRKQ